VFPIVHVDFKQRMRFCTQAIRAKKIVVVIADGVKDGAFTLKEGFNCVGKVGSPVARGSCPLDNDLVVCRRNDSNAGCSATRRQEKGQSIWSVRRAYMRNES